MGADKAYDAIDFVKELRRRDVTPHVDRRGKIKAVFTFAVEMHTTTHRRAAP